MKKRSVFLGCFALIFAGLAFSTTPSFAQKKTVKACQEEWRANEAANEAAKVTEKDYVAKCRADAAKPAATTTTAAPAVAPKPAAKKPADPKQAEYARERACGAEWKAEKAAGKVPGGDDLAEVLERLRQAQKSRRNVNRYYQAVPLADDCRIDNPIRWPVVMLGGGNETARFHQGHGRCSSDHLAASSACAAARFAPTN